MNLLTENASQNDTIFAQSLFAQIQDHLVMLKFLWLHNRHSIYYNMTDTFIMLINDLYIYKYNYMAFLHQWVRTLHPRSYIGLYCNFALNTSK